MDSYEALQAYQKYQSCEGKTFPRGTKEFKCVKVMAGPYDLKVFTKKNKKYREDWIKEVKSGVDREFTL